SSTLCGVYTTTPLQLARLPVTLRGGVFMKTLVLLRHGQSIWNQENLFTGWADVGLSEQGVTDESAAREILRREGYIFDCAFTSVLKRAVKTLWLTLEEMDLMW